MRSVDDQSAFNTLDFLARCNAQIDVFRQQLRQATDLALVSFVESHYYGAELYLCVCLETDVGQGKMLTWWLDIRPQEDNWQLSASVLWNEREPVVQFPPQLMPDFQAVQQRALAILSQLWRDGVKVLDEGLAREISMDQNEVSE